MKFFLEERVNL